MVRNSYISTLKLSLLINIGENMSFQAKYKNQLISKEAKNIPIEEEEEDEEEGEEQVEIQNIDTNRISNQLFLKPAHRSQTLDRDVVLRRIRQRKRINKVRSAVQTLLTSPFSTKIDHHNSVPEKKWVDDAFAAL